MGWQPRLLQAANALRFTQVPRFGRQLRLDPKPCDAIIHTEFGDRKTGLDVSYEIPTAMCIAPIHGTSSKRMPASGVLALFDHLSTYAVSEVDRTHRPGVSLTLSIELTPEHEDVLRSGTELHFACTVDKAGKSVAFVSATVTDPHGNLVATCRHTKYMPLPTGMGLMWGMAFGVAKPITESIYRHILARGDDALSVEDQDDNSKRVADVDANGNKYKSSTVQKESSNTIMHEQSNLVNDLTELIAVRNVVEVSSTDDTGHHIRGTSLPLSVRHTNPLGGLHGGCQAMLSEVLAEELVRERSPSTVLRSIYMEYLRGGVGAGTCTVEARSDGMGGISCRTISDTNAVLSHGKLIWK